MDQTDKEIPEIRLCEVSNEAEAAMVVSLLNEDGVAARSDATGAAPAFGGLPFESGHVILVPASEAHKACAILGRYPHFKDLRNVHEPLD
ncbi:hypothetical protein [Aquisphaera insulae]|uniref:hypothetical protein n=1 Tax=Aquisphaera insulae TaxID=2712864 RepID=UPI0013ED7BFB|nr:hypothetical protein [Aquisphaera insulae]